MVRTVAAGGTSVLLLLLVHAPPDVGGAPAEAWVRSAYAALPLAFEPTRPDDGGDARFLARGDGYSILVRPLAAELRLESRRRLRLEVVGGRAQARVTPSTRVSGRINYLLGNDRSRWRTGVPTYERVTSRGVYPGIDLAYYGRAGRLEYDFVVHPGASPDEIALELVGARSLRLERSGALALELPGATVRQLAPRAYQRVEGRRVTVPSRFLLQGRRVRFAVGPYDRSRTLVIDPSLTYSTYLGGSDDENGYAIAVDASGFAYVTGYTASSDFPTEAAYQGDGTGVDAFVTKLNAAGDGLVYSTYLGGNSYDSGNAIAVDSSGAVYLAGQTLSTDFPLASAYQGTRDVGYDAFVTKLDSSGGGLLYSTYLGGDDTDIASGIAVDSGFAYVTGQTASTTFPTVGAYQGSKAGMLDAFVTKLGTAGDTLAYSTYLGGGSDDIAYGIGVDSGSAFVAGATSSTDFPTETPYQGSLSGTSDAFVTKLGTAGSTLAYSTYLGGSDLETGFAIAVDSGGSAYVAGQTGSTNFPTMGAYQDSNAGLADAFATKLSTTGSALAYSTFLGGGDLDAARGIALDSAGRAYIVGTTLSTNFPIQSEHQATNAGMEDAFVSELSPGGGGLVYSSYLGGGSSDIGNGIAVAAVGHAYVTGQAGSADFPTANPFQGTSGGGNDGFVAKLGQGPTAVAVRSFSAKRSGSGVAVQWRTASEVGVVGFDLFRASPRGRTRVNPRLIGAAGGVTGRAYAFRDRGAGRRYWLRETHADGSRVWRGPVVVR